MAYDQWGNWYDDTMMPGGGYGGGDPYGGDPYAGGGHNPGGDPYVEIGTPEAPPPYVEPVPPQFEIPGQVPQWPGVDMNPAPVAPPRPNYGPAPPPQWNYGGGNWGGGAPPDFSAPRWEAPPEFTHNAKFAAPNEQELQMDPSFKWRLAQGQKALEQSAAGKGVLRTGGTLKDLVNYGQNFATNEYANVYNRKFNEYKFDYDKEADTYSKNYNLKRDVFDRNYKAAYDEYSPKLRGWEVNSQINARQQEALFNREYQMYLSNRDNEQQDLDLLYPK